jgi:hypothetical protein
VEDRFYAARVARITVIRRCLLTYLATKLSVARPPQHISAADWRGRAGLEQPNPTTEGDRLISKAVRFDDYGGVEVLDVRDVARPESRPGQGLVAVRAARVNISEAKIRAGLVREIFPATFPSGEGSDLAGWSRRSARACMT